ncbi:MAG: hypothetical protein M0Z36_00800 [Thermaerobacter sp.]|nr:hypothetical protein [Thermaerobacter sp.]
MKAQPTIALSLSGFFAAAVMTYLSVPPTALSGAGRTIVSRARGDNLFLMVHRLLRSNRQLERNASSIVNHLNSAHKKLQTLQAVGQKLRAETQSNAVVGNTLAREISLNRSLIQSQRQIIQRQGLTLIQNRRLGQNLQQLNGTVTAVSSSLYRLTGATESLNGNLITLSSTLNRVVSSLTTLDQETSLPLVHTPVTSLIPPIFGSGHTTPASRLTSPAVTPTLNLANHTVNSLLGGGL